MATVGFSQQLTMKAILSRQLAGRELLRIFESCSYEEIYRSHIAMDPGGAISKLDLLYGEIPDALGTNISGIDRIREQISLHVFQPKHCHALIITAPHTHWQRFQPIIYQYDINDDCYIVGPQRVYSNDRYRPVSFALTNQGAIPYEWADGTISMVDNEYDLVVDIINAVAISLKVDVLPFGISVDFRFKDSLFSVNTPSIESDRMPNGKHAPHGLAVISKKCQDSRVQGALEQVAWHPYLDLGVNYELSICERSLIQEILTYINNLPDELSKQDFLASLEKVRV